MVILFCLCITIAVSVSAMVGLLLHRVVCQCYVIVAVSIVEQ